MRVAGATGAGFSPVAGLPPPMPGAGGRDDEDDDVVEDGEWTDPQDRDPARDRLIAKKNVERAYREANRHNAKSSGKP